MESRWSDREATELVARLAPRWGEDLALRVYTSRLIGRDPDLVLHGGGNTSLKGPVTTLVGERVEALFVKGSGWDLAAIEPPGLPAVDLVHLRKLRALAELSDEEMVNQLRTHLFDAGAPNPSVETLLHAFLPHRFIDHTHADVALVVTNQPRDEAAAMVREAFGPRWAIVPYVMPGFALAKLAAEVYERDPSAEGLVLMNHGLFTFADDARTAYERMIAGVDRAERFVRARTCTRPPPGRGARPEVPPAEAAARLAPVLRGALAEATGDADRPWRRMILEHRASEETLDILTGPDAARIADANPLTPDHVIRTKGPGAPAAWRSAARRCEGVARAPRRRRGHLPRRVRRLLRGQPPARAHPGHEARFLPARRPGARCRRARRRAHQAGGAHRGRHRRAHAASQGARQRDRPLRGAR